MRPSLLYRTASVLLLLFAAGHTLGFRRPTEGTGSASVAELMRSVHFTVQSYSRTYWDFYVGFGLFVTVFLLFSAVLSWQLGGLRPEVFATTPRAATWGLAICFLAVAILTWRYFFVAPGVFSTLITACLVAAAWQADGSRTEGSKS